MTATMHGAGHPAPPAPPAATPMSNHAGRARRAATLRSRLLGALLALLLVAGCALLWGHWRWQSGTTALRNDLVAARQPMTPTRFDAGELAALPPPVQRYLRLALQDGQPMITAARFTHRGTFNMGQSEPRWTDFTSDQIVSTRRPGFDWDGRIAMAPGLSVRVHDAYVAGQGLLVAKLMGLLPLADIRGTPELAQGELMRYLSETPWYPSALLPSQGVRWQAIDERSARATLADGATTVGVVFGFGADGLIESVYAEARARTVGDRIEMRPWQVRVWGYERHHGVLIPSAGEVSWLLPQGPYPYWRGRIETINYETAR